MRAIRFGISRGHGKSNLVEAGRRLTEALGAACRREVRLHVAADYEALFTDVIERGVEVAWLPPLVHARAVPRGAHLVAVSLRGGNLTYRAALIVAKEAPARRVDELRDVRAAWTDPRSASGYLFPRRHLTTAGVTFASEKFLGAGFAVCAAVADGEADVGACHVSEAAGTDPARAAADVKAHFTAAEWRLRVLEVTDSIPPDGIVVAPSVPDAERAGIVEALLGLHRGPAGAMAVRDLFSAEQLVPVDAQVRWIVDRLRDA